VTYRFPVLLLLFAPLLVACGGGGGGNSTSPAGLSIRSVNPGSGPESGGVTVAVGGTGFNRGIQSVFFDGKPARDVVVTSDSNINGTTPPHDHGWVSVLVVADTGEQVTLENGYEYGQPPYIFLVAPPAGGAGLTVAITGRYFDDGSGRPPDVYFGEIQSLLPQMVNGTYILADAPLGQPGPGAVDVTVVTDYGSDTLVNGFVYTTAK